MSYTNHDLVRLAIEDTANIDSEEIKQLYYSIKNLAFKLDITYQEALDIATEKALINFFLQSKSPELTLKSYAKKRFPLIRMRDDK
ncbi:MAG: hypothetical protein LLG05_10465 [Porphyromonadaceae bacterium]|nr:hypothetical protein [Porphyromonadaceae bacterium]